VTSALHRLDGSIRANVVGPPGRDVGGAPERREAQPESADEETGCPQMHHRGRGWHIHAGDVIENSRTETVLPKQGPTEGADSISE